MSTEGSDSTSSSGIRQFGLYRTIDARTEEFLRLSRKRQIRQGCACAAISTAITVTIVIIVLLIYEYMIVVETNVVQKKTSSNKIRFIGKDKPIAERLDRTHFGFDQDYYERMPLLVNALQEVSYVDSLGETSISRSRKRHYNTNRFKSATSSSVNGFIRRTSPRPFIFEYRSPYPMPFSKSQGTPRNWAEHYRNAQRLKNLHDVIKYLEKTLNAKFGDIYLPTRAQIAFSGIYLPPAEHPAKDSYLPVRDNSPQESINYKVNSNHNSDPLYTFRPDNPGDINLLVDGYRFAPSVFSSLSKQKNNGIKHVFRPITKRKRPQNCNNAECSSNLHDFAKKVEIESSQEDISLHDHDSQPKLLDIKFNLFSSQQSTTESSLNESNINKIYITSPKPLFQFRRKSTMPFRRSMYTYKRPNIFVEKRKNITITAAKTGENKTITFKRLVPLSVFTSNERTEKSSIQPIVLPENSPKEESNSSSTTPRSWLNFMTEHPMLNYSLVEDYHIGSSGIVPIESRTITPIYPTVPIIPLIESITERATTNAPEIIKFSPEDAKIPDHYFNLRKSDIEENTERVVNKWDYTKITEKYDDVIEAETLIIKLKNNIETTTITEDDVSDEIENSKNEEAEDYIETKTSATYVPQINGHHRSYKSLTTLLRENSEKYRKKRIENLFITRTIQNQTYVPMYVEIKRNRSSFIDHDIGSSYE
ncbi:uncharacterized protein LOC112045765 [Bicyclus anynana]|uniref:Uncharacterized protein LOC112045765 n=1 Tax=Bicyclus anynana TaxID=110368 RepID=A0A6J1MY32_BICAN|nr:uncharacterized protein LOC112045765 [Bicyclus anynana]